MMRWLLLASLMFSCNLLAARLQTNATADTYLYDQVSVEGTAGSFTISAGGSSAVSFTAIQGTSGQEGRNYGGATTNTIGYTTAEWKGLLRYDVLDDSMKARATGKNLRWDSARVILTMNAAITSGDSLTLAIYELRSSRRFGEGTATGSVTLGSSWFNYDSTSGVASPWTTIGCNSTASDFHNTLLDTTATLVVGTTGAGVTTSFKIPGTSIADTVNNAGFVIMYHRIGVNDGASSLAFRSDDYTTNTAHQPSITVYYTEMEYPDFGGADTLLLKATNDATTIGVPVMTFDISTVTATATLGACSVYVYVNASYSDNSEGTIGNSIGIAMKPINIGTGTGGATATGKLHWASWFENGNTDSTWGAIGATDIGAVCNRSSATGDDKTTDTSLSLNVLSGTGWRSVAIDTMAVRAYLNGTCANFAVFMQPTASITDDAWYVLSSVEGSNDPYLVINYTPGAVTATVGTGRFGRSQTGEYLNVR